ncbi:hypothetical protein F5Y15DRAFT_397695 [Xylariaceae sp. FL0016]|nr:hypothetical protein F5Y15DRAFT_397695 [Xylariaceae sp. FL0016]
MEHSYSTDLKRAYEAGSVFETHRSTPAPAYQKTEGITTTEPTTCLFCRRTLTLSYFNCCAICGNAIPCGRRDDRERDSPHTQQPQLPLPSTSVSTTGYDRELHCKTAYCKYTHNRWLLYFFVLCEAVPMAGALMLLGKGLYQHEWIMLRFGVMVAIQWYQIFVLPRQWHAGHSIVPGQLAAAFFMVWFYVNGRDSLHWWEPFAISSVLLKIIFPW